MVNHQFSDDLVVGANGDLWFKRSSEFTSRLSRFKGLTFGESRGDYVFINNLPPINKVVEFNGFSIILHTREKKLIRILEDSTSHYEMTGSMGILDAWMFKSNLIFLTYQGEVGVFGYRDLSKLFPISTIILSGVDVAYPMSINVNKVADVDRGERLRQGLFWSGNGYNSLLVVLRDESVNPSLYIEDQLMSGDKFPHPIPINRAIGERILDVEDDVILTNDKIISLTIDYDNYYRRYEVNTSKVDRPNNCRSIVSSNNVTESWYYLIGESLISEDGNVGIDGVIDIARINIPTLNRLVYLIGQDRQLYSYDGEGGLNKMDIPITLTY